jgi:hypothetical protein
LYALHSGRQGQLLPLVGQLGNNTFYSILSYAKKNLIVLVKDKYARRTNFPCNTNEGAAATLLFSPKNSLNYKANNNTFYFKLG